MMNRTVMALIIPALLAAGAAQAAEMYNKDGNRLDLYGKVDGLHYFSSDSHQNGDQSYARLGFKGETQINGLMTGYGQWEYNLNADSAEDDGSQSYTRLAFAGVKAGEFGSFDYGRNYGVLYDVEGWTDMLPEFGGDSYTSTDNFMTGRATGVATYRDNDFFGLVEGLNIALQYQGKNENPGMGEGTGNGSERSIRNANGEGVGVSTTYNIGMGFSAGAAYTSSDRTTEQKHAGLGHTQFAGGERADAWTTGVKYDANNLYIAAMYADTRNMTSYGSDESRDGGGIANKTRNIELTAQYQFDFGLRPAISYLQSKGQELNLTEGGSDKDLVKYADIGATYYFNKNMSTYVDYKINLLDGDDSFYKHNGISTDDVVAMGLVYQF